MAFPGTYNFNYYRGDTFEFVIRPKNTNGTPYDLSAFQVAQFTIANQRGPGTVANPRIVYNAEATINVVENIITCRVSSVVGRNLAPGTTWVYDVEIQDSTATNIFTLLTGNISSTDDITGASA
jgi:hypothetical protein